MSTVENTPQTNAGWGGCGETAYCGKACQAQDWRAGHALICGQPANEQKATIYGNLLFVMLATYGPAEELKRLLSDPIIDPTLDNHIAIRVAVSNGRVDLFRVLLDDPYVDPNFGLEPAARYNRYEIMRLLLDDPRIDPARNNNEAIYSAARYGSVDVVRMLLQDQRVDPTANANAALQAAVENNHNEVYSVLMADPRVKHLRNTQYRQE